jgi:hypothetical protein
MAEIEAPALATRAASGIVSYDGDGPENILSSADLQETRAVWWRLLSQGLWLPAECGVIVLPGDRQ